MRRVTRLAIERKLSKDQILTNYLNISNFGDGAYGVEAASEHYFGIHAKQLNVVQAATLAGIVNAPDSYDPKLHPKKALSRRNLVIDQMVVSKYLTEAQAKYAKTFPLGLSTAYKPSSDGCEAAGSAAFFCDYVRTTLLNDPKFGATKEVRQHRLFDGGLTIKTSIDPTTQAQAQNAVNTIPPGGRVATAIVVMQPGTGNVLAMAVNRTYGDTTDHLPVLRQGPEDREDRREQGPLSHQIQLCDQLSGLPARIDVQDVHPRGGAGKGTVDVHQFLLAGLHLFDELRRQPDRRKLAMHC